MIDTNSTRIRTLAFGVLNSTHDIVEFKLLQEFIENS